MVFDEVSGAQTYLFLFSQDLRYFKLLVFILFFPYIPTVRLVSRVPFGQLFLCIKSDISTR